MDDPKDKHSLSDLDKRQLWLSIQSDISVRRKKIRTMRQLMGAGAACFFLAVGVSLWMNRWAASSDESLSLMHSAAYKAHLPTDTSGKIRLVLGDGHVIQLEDESAISYRDSSLEITQNGVPGRHLLPA